MGSTCALWLGRPGSSRCGGSGPWGRGARGADLSRALVVLEIAPSSGGGWSTRSVEARPRDVRSLSPAPARTKGPAGLTCTTKPASAAAAAACRRPRAHRQLGATTGHPPRARRAASVRDLARSLARRSTVAMASTPGPQLVQTEYCNVVVEGCCHGALDEIYGGQGRITTRAVQKARPAPAVRAATMPIHPASCSNRAKSPAASELQEA